METQPAVEPGAAGGSLRQRLIGSVWRGVDPFADFAFSPDRVDVQGWLGSEHSWFEAMIGELRPKVIVEVGVWKGASALHMGRILRDRGIAGVVIAVDTWLGSVEHWLNPEWFDSLRMRQGRPSMQQTFMNNVVSERLQDHVLPLPLDSNNAAELLGAHGIEADLIHIDAGHDQNSVAADIAAWWQRLRPGGVLIGDDYYPDGAWPGVKAAFDAFAAQHRLPFDHLLPKVRMRKPATAPAAAIPAVPPDLAGTLPELLDYVGEFGPELVLFVSFCRWLSEAGLLRGHRIGTYRGMRCFYEDLDCVEIVEKAEPRHYLPPQQRPAWLPVRNEHDFDGAGRPTRHLYPDLRARFGLLPLLPDLGSRPLLIVHNKHNDEWGGGPVNHISLETLDTAFRLLKHDFTVVYVRHGMGPPEPDFSDDHNRPHAFADRHLLDRHPEILGFDDLYAAHQADGGTQDINRFKNVLYSRCHRFISSQGGGAHHIAMFSGSLLVVLHRHGQETGWAYGEGYYSFMAEPAPVRAICRNEHQLVRALSLFAGSAVAGNQLRLAPEAEALLADFPPGPAPPYRKPQRRPNFTPNPPA